MNRKSGGRGVDHLVVQLLLQTTPWLVYLPIRMVSQDALKRHTETTTSAEAADAAAATYTSNSVATTMFDSKADKKSEGFEVQTVVSWYAKNNVSHTLAIILTNVY